MSQNPTILPDAREIFCPSCGYDLRGLTSDRCPECGLAIDPETMSRSVIPWSHRQQIGRWRAFWRTVWMAGRYPTQLAREAARPVSYADAQKFRWLVVLVGTIPLAATALIARWAVNEQASLAGMLSGPVGFPTLPRPVWTDPLICIYTGWLIWAAPTTLFLLLLAGISGASSYFFHPPSLSIVRQNRAIALSYYACAPLALMFIPVALGAVAAVMQFYEWDERETGLMMIVAEASIPAIFFCCWFSTLKILRQSTHCSGARLLAAAVGVPLIWLALSVMIVAVLAGIFGLVKLMIVSSLG